MTRRIWSHCLASTALALLMSSAAFAEEAVVPAATDAPAAALPAAGAADPATPASVVAAPPGGRAGDRAEAAPEPDASALAATLANPLALPTDAPPGLAVEIKPPVVVVLPAKPVEATPATGSVGSAPVEPQAVTVAAEDFARSLQTALAGLERQRGSADERKLRQALVAFYAERGHAALWTTGLGASAKAVAAAERFGRAAEDGLDPADYAVAVPARGATADDLAQAEIAFAEAALRYASHAQSGRFDPIRLSELVTAKPLQIDPTAVLAGLAEAADVSAALAAYNPPHEGYKRLKAKLAELGGLQPPPKQAVIPAGPSLKPGGKDLRVAALRERLGVAGTASDAEVFDEPLVLAVKAFQKGKGITPSGIVGPATLSALNEQEPSVGRATADIVANMERWRWLPRDLGSLHVFVNIPDFQAQVVREGTEIHRTRVIVGRVQNQTPVFSDTMSHIIVNPYWNVPVSILKKEMLGKIQETAGAYLDRGNYEVVVGSKVLSASAVDWASVNPASVHVRQRPGAGNALGNVKFMFPNQHSVYLHDTPSRGLFQQAYRALSHGCVRVFEPFAFADAVLSEEPGGIDGKKLKGMVGSGGERYIWLKRKLDVHLAYFTTFVGDDGKLETRPDLYGHNGRTKKLLGL